MAFNHPPGIIHKQILRVSKRNTNMRIIYVQHNSAKNNTKECTDSVDHFSDKLLIGNHQHQLVTVIFSCGSALIKATGRLNLVASSFIELIRSPERTVIIETFIPGTDLMTPIENMAERIIIRSKTICSIERL